jgi:ubiquinone/menaquinone biosynthesis C-methylase UbiE
MSFFEREETNQFTFEAFAAHPFYTEINRSLVQQAIAPLATRPPDAALTVVDMACGTGAITRLIAEELARQGRQARIIAVDPSADALRRAQKSIEEMGAQADFFQGEAIDLPTLVHDADAAFFCNAIHLIADKSATFRQMAAILAPSGIFACNSAFYNGTNIESTLRFSRLWIRRAVQWLRKAHPEVQLSRGAKAIAMEWLTPEEYSSLLKESGFSRVETFQEPVMMSLDGLRDLGRYWLFIEGALPGAPLALGAAALGTAVYQAGQELSMTEVLRMWVQIIARNGEGNAQQEGLHRERP